MILRVVLDTKNCDNSSVNHDENNRTAMLQDVLVRRIIQATTTRTSDRILRLLIQLTQ